MEVAKTRSNSSPRNINVLRGGEPDTVSGGNVSSAVVTFIVSFARIYSCSVETATRHRNERNILTEERKIKTTRTFVINLFSTVKFLQLLIFVTVGWMDRFRKNLNIPFYIPKYFPSINGN